MATAYKQDLPPKGGYGSIHYARIFHKQRFSGITVIVGGISIMAFGWVVAIRSNREKTYELKEQLFGRNHLLPLLQSEEDRRILRSMLEFEKQEAMIMKDVPGWQVGKSVYNTEKWIPPHPAQLRVPAKDYLRCDD